MGRISLGALCGLGICAAALTTNDAKAHFRLESPTNMTAQNGAGDPQKSAPCGAEVGTITTGVVTPFEPGETITITFNETVYHPGHYRVTLSENGPEGLPEDQCTNVEIQDPPVYPVLADGILPHDSPLEGEQTFEVTLPDDITCDNCVLQVVQYMSESGGGCFYHHCAEISIGAEASETTGDPSTTTGDPTGDGSTTGTPATTGETSAGNSDTGSPFPPAGGDDTAAGGSSSSAGTGTDSMEQDDSSGGGGGCSTAGGGAGVLALLPLLFATRRRRRFSRGA